jgi:hypothetical protein
MEVTTQLIIYTIHIDQPACQIKKIYLLQHEHERMYMLATEPANLHYR